MSFGGDLPSMYEKFAFEEVYAKGVLAVCSAGNAGNDYYHFPASFDTVISVAAVNNKATLLRLWLCVQFRLEQMISKLDSNPPHS